MGPLAVEAQYKARSSARGSNTMDANSEKALQQTVEVLVDRGKRQGAINESPAAKQADAYARGIGNDRDAERIYQIAAEVFKTKIRDANGDPRQLQELLLKDPEKVYESFTPEQKRMIRNLASEIEGRKKPAAP